MTQPAAHTIATPLVDTKLHAPRRRRRIVHRPRLNSRLLKRDQPALTLISAPAGFGKTTLLTEWFGDEGEERCTAWLSLDVRDNEPAMFFAYLIAAIQSVAPQVGVRALSLLQSSPPPIEPIVATILNDLDALAAEIVLVLDDYHVIETAELHDGMAFFLEHMPPQAHLVVASRTDPPFPLGRLRARGDLLEVRLTDLRFTVDEAALYFSDAIGLDLSPENVQALATRTEGWIAALQLAALSMQGRDDLTEFIDNFTGDDRFVVDYLAEEVLDRQPEDVRTFLLQTSILGRLTGSLCDAVTGRTGGSVTLEDLDRANLFLVPLDDRRLWYRYHHLFADVLRARLLDEDAALAPVLHQRASEWYEANNDVGEAIAHAMAGDDFGRAARLIELTAPLLRQQRQERTLRRWLEALPEDTLARQPVLAINLVGARMVTGDTNGVEGLLASVERCLEPSAPSPLVFDRNEFASLPAQVLVYRAALALLTGDLDGTVAHASAALALVDPADHLRHGSASALLGLAHWSAGDLETGQERYVEAIDALLAAGHLADALGCSLALADMQIAQGRLSDATQTFESGLRLTGEHPGLRGAADMHIGLSEVLIERNDLDGAAEHLETSAELGESAGLPQHAYRWRVTQARLCRARGDLITALALIDEAVPLFDTDFSPPVRPVEAIRARVQLAAGDLAAARGWVTGRGLTVHDDLSYVREYEHITLARVLIAGHATNGDRSALDGAAVLLERLFAAADEGGRAGSAIEIRILQATAEHGRGDTPAALDALEDALRRAEPEGYVRLFFHAGPAVSALLRSIVDRNDAPAHARRIMATSAPTAVVLPVTSASPTPMVDELSARELDVLRLLRTDLSGPDIARELMVSLNTMRTHTRNIFAKLGATNRREAVRRADELGL